MSQLRIFAEADGSKPLKTLSDHAAIERELGAAGVRFEKWEASKPVAPGASQDEVIAAYHAEGCVRRFR